MINTDSILNTISQLQSPGNTHYPKGIFPSQRIHPISGYLREDGNIFFSSLIVYTLNKLWPHFNEQQRAVVSSISSAVRENYPRFIHKRQPDTYNFWATGNQSHFPNGIILHKFSKLALPADTDDTSLIYLTNDQQQSIDLLKREYENQYSPDQPSSPLTPREYRDLKAYPTFLGKRMVREMDACVICNVLLLVLDNGMSYTRMDTDSIEFLKRVLRSKDYLKTPFQISPNYSNSAVILYHIARLVASHKLQQLIELRTLVIQCLQEQIQNQWSYMELLLLNSSLLKLDCPAEPLSLLKAEDHFKRFYFFQAGMLTGLQKAYLNHLASNSFFHLKYRCSAYYWALLLENMLLFKDYTSSRS